jgi:hypothetical protein
MAAHYIISYQKKTFDLSIISYLYTNSAATVKALITLFIAVLTTAQTGIIDYTEIHGFATIFLAGYAIDNSVNSSKEVG